ncbi:hypothetical protein ACFQ0X_43530 [Streptomyces rectiviolaceus]|uniref:hypothetical protein n=1 Tax=Streptomyces rectiviolaceus TaxID=332591 RepID=UPI00363ABCD5
MMSGRVHIPVICHIRKRGTEIRCTLSPTHKGDHRNPYARASWPRRAGETQTS